MAGIRRFKLLLGIFIPFFAFLLMSQNTSAVSGKVDFTQAWNDYVWIYTSSQASTWGQGANFGTPIYDGLDPINGFTFNVSLDQIPDQYGTYTSGYIDFTLSGYGYWGVDGGDLSNALCEVWTSGGSSRITSNIYISKGYYAVDGNRHAVDYRCEFEASNKQPAYAYIRVGTNRNGDNSIIPIMYGWHQTGVRTQPQIRNVSYTYNTSNEGLENAQLGDLINGQKNIYDQNQEYYDKNYEAVENIENQNSSDIQGSENGQTTSLINVISGFISAFSGINATNCNLTLEFPYYAGGSRVVNICSGKDKAPRIVEIGSSLLLICVFVPLAFIMVRMIYNEIRSWTNG